MQQVHLRVNDAATGNVNPGTAAAFTSQDGVTWTLKLRPGIKFTDGNAATLTYTFSGVSVTKQIQRQVFSMPKTVCSQ